MAQPLSYPLLGLSVTDGVAVVTLDDPARRNAMTMVMTQSWQRVLDDLAARDDVAAVVVTGAGSAFCAGGDLSWIGAEEGASVVALRARMLPFYRAWLAVADMPVPTIAALNGPAVGAGACLALACDLRYAARSATVSLPFTRLGMHPGMAATWLLPQAVGPAVARELLLTGRTVAGEELASTGLVAAVVDDDALLGHVTQVASRVASTAPAATQLVLAATRHGFPASLEEALRWEALAQPVTLATADLAEGVAAARERRPPRFTGR